MPDRLAGQAFLLQAETAADVADAERAVDRLNSEARGLADSEAVARLLLRAEAVASSRIEGLEVGSRRLLWLSSHVAWTTTQATSQLLKSSTTSTQCAGRSSPCSDAETVTIDHLLAIHARLLAGTRLERYAGEIRDDQNWIGGSSHNPCSAAFVPPPPEHVRGLLEDLCEFCNGDALPTVAQAALAHAQFETIHPFVDGNGRTGRALIHIVLRRRGLAPRVVPPISLVLATLSDDYVNGLTKTRYAPGTTAEHAGAALNAWIAFFAAATERAVGDAQDYERRVADVQARWRERVGRVRADSAASLLIERPAWCPGRHGPERRPS